MKWGRQRRGHFRQRPGQAKAKSYTVVTCLGNSTQPTVPTAQGGGVRWRKGEAPGRVWVMKACASFKEGTDRRPRWGATNRTGRWLRYRGCWTKLDSGATYLRLCLVTSDLLWHLYVTGYTCCYPAFPGSPLFSLDRLSLQTCQGLQDKLMKRNREGTRERSVQGLKELTGWGQTSLTQWNPLMPSTGLRCEAQGPFRIRGDSNFVTAAYLAPTGSVPEFTIPLPTFPLGNVFLILVETWDLSNSWFSLKNQAKWSFNKWNLVFLFSSLIWFSW